MITRASPNTITLIITSNLQRSRNRNNQSANDRPQMCSTISKLRGSTKLGSRIDKPVKNKAQVS